MSEAEKSVLDVFRKYLVTPGQMLCFYGPDLERLKKALSQLTAKRLLIAESFKGAYSLTDAGYSAMKDCARDEQT